MSEFIFCKIPYFRHILMYTFRWMLLKYESYSLTNILFSTFKQHLDYKILIAKLFDGNALQVKASKAIYITKNKNPCAELFLNRNRALYLRIGFMCVRSSVQVKLLARKFESNETNLLQSQNVCENLISLFLLSLYDGFVLLFKQVG